MKILRSLQERCSPEVGCLIVVDVPNDFCSPKGASHGRRPVVRGSPPLKASSWIRNGGDPNTIH